MITHLETKAIDRAKALLNRFLRRDVNHEPDEGTIYKRKTDWSGEIEIDGVCYTHPLWPPHTHVYVFVLNGKPFDPSVTRRQQAKDWDFETAIPSDDSLSDTQLEHILPLFDLDELETPASLRAPVAEKPVGIGELLWHSIGHPEPIWLLRLREAESGALCARLLRRRAASLLLAGYRNTNATIGDRAAEISDRAIHLYRYLTACLPMPVIHRLIACRKRWFSW